MNDLNSVLIEGTVVGTVCHSKGFYKAVLKTERAERVSHLLIKFRGEGAIVVQGKRMYLEDGMRIRVVGRLCEGHEENNGYPETWVEAEYVDVRNKTKELE